MFLDNYINTRGAYKQGGLEQKGPFNEAKDALIKTLDDCAEFVDGIANGNENIVTLAGYVPTKTGTTPTTAPGQPQDVKITRGVIGELFVECPKVDGADAYGCIMVKGSPLPPNIGLNGLGQLVVVSAGDPSPAPDPPAGTIMNMFDLNKSRKKHFIGLQTGTVYYFYMYAMNSAGLSPLSEVRNLMCG